ncbi:MAG: patatin-like phospholipase family protein [Gammaproteobacteria bacterium]|jgi:NTE family protein
MYQPDQDQRTCTPGLILPGGGARAAYQAGVLRAVAELMPRCRVNPFPVVTGVSAGAINASVLASNALWFRRGVARLCGVWEHMRTDLIYRTDAGAVAGSALRWLFALLTFGFGIVHPRSLLDDTPLRRMLETQVRFARIQQAIDTGALRALAISVSGYTSARSISFFQGADDIPEWERARRLGRRTRLGLDHLMASVALPLIFPAQRIGSEFFGDGSMRQSSPLSPAIHLGADRLLIVAVRNEEPNHLPAPHLPLDYPSFGQIAGYMLDTLFMDSLYTDLERLSRINRTLSVLPSPERGKPATPLRHIDTMVIVPSRDIREIARNHAREFPRAVRLLLRGVGALNAEGRQLMSYLLFESGYCGELVELGYRDALARRDELIEFLQLDRLSTQKKRPQSKERKEAEDVG